MTKLELAERISSAVKDLISMDEGCVTIELDSRLAVCVGWLNGYDPEDESCIHSKNSPTWCINAGLKVWTSDSMRTDYEFINAPYFRSGDVWMTDVAISPDALIEELADYFLKEYEAMKACVIEEDGLIDNFKTPEDYCSGIVE